MTRAAPGTLQQTVSFYHQNSVLDRLEVEAPSPSRVCCNSTSNNGSDGAGQNEDRVDHARYSAKMHPRCDIRDDDHGESIDSGTSYALESSKDDPRVSLSATFVIQ